MKPTVLVATSERWFSTARLVVGLAKAGFGVEAFCPLQHPLAKTSIVSRLHTYMNQAPLRSLADAIAAAKPDLIVPADDVATRQLHQLHDLERSRGKAGRTTCTLIERSLGASENFSSVEHRAAILHLARAADTRVPETEIVTTIAELEKCLARFGLPTVLKADGTSGGTGVRIVHTLEEAKRAFRELHTAPRSSRSPIQTLIRQGKASLWPTRFRGQSVVSAQVFVTGCDAISEVACWRGSVLASLHFQVLTKQYPGGPSSVVRIIENAEMDFAVRQVARQLGLSGLHGFDFVLEEGTGDAYLVEMNPRATQVGHLTLGPGRDLPAALYAAVTEEPVQVARKVTENPTIALFPQEWTRNRTSAYLESGYHDVPWDEPELVRAGILSCPERTVGSSEDKPWVGELSAVPLPRP